jgi:hypothetical protein
MLTGVPLFSDGRRRAGNVGGIPGLKALLALGVKLPRLDAVTFDACISFTLVTRSS